MISFSILESWSGDQAKSITLSSNNKLIKRAPIPIKKGLLKLQQAKDILEFKEILESAKPHQCFIYGIDHQYRSEAKVLTKDNYKKLSDKTEFTTRTKDHLIWNKGGGILFLDIDDYDGNAYEALKLLFPKIEETKILKCYSSSGNLWLDGEMIHESKNKLRFYIPVSNTSDIDRVLEILKTTKQG